MKYTPQKRISVVIFSMISLFALTGLACRVSLPDFGELANLLPATDTPTLPEALPELPAVEPVEIIQRDATGSSEESTLISLYARINPAVVNITSLIDENGQFSGYSEGSGFVFNQEGYIVTNAHVVHGANGLDVTFSNNATRPATLIGEDFSSDLAVIKVENLPEGISPLALGEINTVQVGQTVVAIGNPFGFDGTMTRGIVSAIGRTIPALNTFSIPQAIQTDAPINPGNSGGPLLNLDGEVIGVNAQIRTSSTEGANSGVGFAIPVSILRRVIPALIADGQYTWPWLGVVGGDLDWVTAQAMNLSVDRGAYLSQIIENGPAFKAGLQGTSGTGTVDGRTVETGGDVVIAIDGQPVYSFDDMLMYIALKTSPGQEVTLTVLRDGKEQQITLRLEPRPTDLSAPLEPDIQP